MSPVLLLALSLLLAPPDEAVDLIIRDARVITLDGRSRIAEGVAIRGDRIVAVGSVAEVTALAGPKSSVIDAKGKTLLPGLIDSHVAFPTRFKEGRLPTRAELDAVAPDHPVLHQAGPAGVANSKALEMSGITRDTPDPPAGRIVKDPATGEPTGLLRNAYSLLKGLPKDAYGGEAGADPARLKALFRLYNERGLTSVADRATSDEALTLYRTLRDRGELTVRVNATRVLWTMVGGRIVHRAP